MSETVKFKPKVSGDTLMLEKSEIEDITRINQAVTELVLKDGSTVRVKGGYYNACEKLDMKAKPGGLEEIGEDDTLRRDKKLSHFFEN